MQRLARYCRGGGSNFKPSVPELCQGRRSPLRLDWLGIRWADFAQRQTERPWPKVQTIPRWAVAKIAPKALRPGARRIGRPDVHLDAALVDDVAHHAAAGPGRSAFNSIPKSGATRRSRESGSPGILVTCPLGPRFREDDALAGPRDFLTASEAGAHCSAARTFHRLVRRRDYLMSLQWWKDGSRLFAGKATADFRLREARSRFLRTL
jgi:hypothetical protein